MDPRPRGEGLKMQRTLKLTTILALCTFAWLFQSTLVMNWDICWALEVTQRMAAGGSYTQNFFDMNPPLFFYLLRPTLYIATLFSTDQFTALHGYLFALALLSTFICYHFARLFFLKEHQTLLHLFFAMLLTAFLIYPLSDFGCREYLLLIFSMPYFFAVTYRLQGHTIPLFSALAIGLFAVMGFALKPYFLIPLALVELYVMYYTRNLLSWWRPEFLIICICLPLYALFILLFYPDYLSTVMPLVKRLYHAGFNEPMSKLLTDSCTGIFILAILCHWLTHKSKSYKIFSTILTLAMTGFFFSYLIQGTTWDYRTLPVYAVALCILLLNLSLFVIKHKKNALLVLAAPLMASIFLIPLLHLTKTYQFGLIFKKSQAPLIQFLQTNAVHQPVYFMTVDLRAIFPAVNYANAISASRLVPFWIPSMIDAQYENALSPQQLQDETYFINMIAEDIDRQKPKFVLVEAKKNKAFIAKPFEYIPYLSKNSNFRAAWTHYHYVTTVEQDSFYKFTIYQRHD